jgi:hypothetical protein
VIAPAFHTTSTVQASSWRSCMTTSRTESQQPGRRRSNTTQSTFRNPPLVSAPLKIDDSKVLNSWVHDPKESATVIFNQAYWQGVAEGDMLRVTGTHSDGSSGFLFEVPQDDGCAKPQLQVLGNSRRTIPWFLNLQADIYSEANCRHLWFQK